jgi:hypothetical protein
MGRWKAWALAWLLAATLSALLLQAPSARGAELLVNGGFEADPGSEWAVSSGDVLGRVDAPSLVHSGSHAGKLACYGPDKCAIQQLVGAVGSAQQYALKAYVAWDDSEVFSLSVRVQWFDEQASETSHADASADCTVEDDMPYDCLTTGSQVAPTSARFAQVSVVIFLKDGVESSVVYLDDFSFTGPPAPTPTPSPTQTPPPTASPSPSATPRPVASPSPTAVPGVTPSPPAPTPAAGLMNGGFEEADGEGKPLAWRKWGGVLSRSSAAAREGQFAAAFTSRTTSTKWAYQTVAVQGGEAYVLSGYALKNDANVAAAYLRLSWYASPDGSGRLIDNVDSTTRLTDDSPEFRFLTSGPVAAPAEAASAKVRLMLDPLSEMEGTVYFDAISFGETTMPPEPVETPGPSPTLASSESPAASAVAPAASPAEGGPSSSPQAARPSPAVLGATSGAPEPTVSSLNGFSQSKTVSEGSPTRTPAALYRELRGDQSTQGEGRVSTGSDEGGGFSLTVLVLAMALPAVAVAAIGPFVWRRWRRRGRPP